MKVKCPNCGKEIIIDYEGDLEATIWNLDGESSDVEMLLYCENCDEFCKVEIHYKMIATQINRVSKRYPND